ncbi:MAG: TIGR03546 family protein [Deltaproteobacteria bacterium]|nr:TIGR03546 family protein [Deltaproteobacteria bacterium]
MVRLIFKLIKIIHSDRDPRQICLGFSLGMIIGLTPLLSVHNLVVLLAILFFRVNISAAILSWAVFSLVAFILDPLFHQLGLIILTKTEFLTGIWMALYNAPLVPYTHFNNSVVMGSLAFSLVALYPVYLGGLFVVVSYRETFMERFERWKIVKVMKASSLYKLYARYNELMG